MRRVIVGKATSFVSLVLTKSNLVLLSLLQIRTLHICFSESLKSELWIYNTNFHQHNTQHFDANATTATRKTELYTFKTELFFFQIWFLSRSSNGMLLYNGGQSSGSGDFISVNIVNGFLVLSYDLGSGVARISSLR